jgi:hypothetical protein
MESTGWRICRAAAGRRRSMMRRSSPRRWSRPRRWGSRTAPPGCWRIIWGSPTRPSLGRGVPTACSRGGETFKFSTDPELEAKARDVVGLYLNPPKNAIVLCVDEKSQIQALNRTQPILRSGPDCRRERRTTTSATAPQPCSPRWRSRPARSPTAATNVMARPNSWTSSNASRRPTHAAGCTSCSTTTTPTSTTTSTTGEEPAYHPALHPDIRIVVEPRRGVFLDHHPPSDPPRILRQRQRSRHRDPRLHRRLQRPLPTVRLDQERRGDPPPRHTSTNFRRATLAASARRP